MSSLMIGVHAEDNSSEEILIATTKIPLKIFHIVAKHLPDKLLRLVYDNKSPDSGSAAVNFHAIVKSVSEILHEIDSERNVDDFNGVIAEFIIEPALFEEAAKSEDEADQEDEAGQETEEVNSEADIDEANPKDKESSLEKIKKQMNRIKLVFSVEGE